MITTVLRTWVGLKLVLESSRSVARIRAMQRAKHNRVAPEELIRRTYVRLGWHWTCAQAANIRVCPTYAEFPGDAVRQIRYVIPFLRHTLIA
jgi:hypothetical protein